ncbi:MAG: mannonate dehydratase [Verrucomicrobiae bacterium]|nr:mannonate dehydratase [Verrucomicrobiae bacterium]
MRIAIVLTPMSDHHLRLAAQVGVEEVVARYPGTDLDELMRVRDRVASFGMKLSIVEGYIPKDKIVHGTPGRDEQIADFQKLLRNMGAAGVPICCYNWMPCDDWTRTRVDIRERGGALVTGYNANEDKVPPASAREAIDEKSLWSNLKYMLDRVVPVAEEAGVQLAMHPDDPPLPSFRGHAQIMSSVKGFERLLALHSSPAHGICFCQGTFAEMGVAIPAAIQKFAKHIHYVHFRDVVGTASNFRESFHDNGKTDMTAAMRAYYECGIDVPARPDHVPTLDGEANDPPGYTILGRLFAVGYMRGLMQAVSAE